MNIDTEKRGHGPEPDIDRWLDEAVQQFANTEPRPGLEGRVLARLAEAERQPARNLRWWGVLAISTAALLALVFFTIGRSKLNPVQTPVAHEVTPARTQPEIRKEDGTAAGNNLPRNQSLPPRHNAASRELASLARPGAPKREQFPSPAPLSDEEKMLASYVRSFPGKAAQVARAQAELHKQEELEMAAPWPKNSDPTFTRQD